MNNAVKQESLDTVMSILRGIIEMKLVEAYEMGYEDKGKESELNVVE